MKKLPFALLAIVAASFSLSSHGAAAVVPATPADRTAALLASGADLRISQVTVVVDPNRIEARSYNGEYRNDGYRHHRHYRTVRVVRYRHGVRYVSYRRVYYR